jgi:ATP-dependent DNA helicase RecG
MPEQQNIEYKQSWHDDYLKWVCGFANAQGGVIFTGKDDDGKVVGVDDSKKLMENLPNKIRNTMGISAEVNLQEEKGKYFIEIITTTINSKIISKTKIQKRIVNRRYFPMNCKNLEPR